MARRRKIRNFPTDPVPAHIESLSHDGKGVAHIDGKATFVAGALPGEEVMIRLHNRHRSYDEAVTVEVLKASADRVEPKCAHYELCGGCSLQHLSHEAQIAAKQSILVEAFKRLGKLDIPTIQPPITGDVWGYRRKARLGVRFVTKKDKVLVGFRERASSFITEITRCEVLHPAVGEKLPQLAALIQSLSIFNQLPQIEVAVAENTTALVFRNLADVTDDDRHKLMDFGREHEMQIHLQPKGPKTVHCIWPEEDDGLVYYLPEYEVENHFRPIDFTQVNHSINHQMVRKALELLQLNTEDRVLDLFCGLGNFTLPISRQAGIVIGVEGDQGLVQRARDNARFNKAENVEYHVSDLTEDMLTASWASGGFNKVLLDPPRSGAFEVLPLIAKLGPERIVYVSCNPATLARDAGELVHQLGYRLVSAGIMDMFPHTGHVESIAIFEKK